MEPLESRHLLAPLAVDDVYRVPYASRFDTFTVVAASGLLANDSGTDLVAVEENWPAGMNSYGLSSDGGFSVTPQPSWMGEWSSYSFTYRADDGVETSSSATVTIGGFFVELSGLGRFTEV